MDTSAVEDRSAALNAALAAAQAEMSNPKFDRQNPYFNSKYATLAAVRDAVVPVLAKHGIAVTQTLETTASGVRCITTLRHKAGGELVSPPLELPAAKLDAQGLGSAATYCRRYQLMAIACVVGDEDDDGNAAVGGLTKAVAAPPALDQKLSDGLKAAATLEELKAAWNAIPAGLRKHYLDLKESAKQRITEATNA